MAQNLRVVPPAEPVRSLIVRCRFHGDDKERKYHVDTSESDRVFSILQGTSKAFLCMETLDGRAVYINLRHARRLSINEGLYTPDNSPISDLIYRLVGERESVESDIDFQCLVSMNICLEEFDEREERFLFLDKDAPQTVAISIAPIMYLEFPSHWHELGVEELEDEERF